MGGWKHAVYFLKVVDDLLVEALSVYEDVVKSGFTNNRSVPFMILIVFCKMFEFIEG
jgi:hypothetical protein